MGNQPPSANAGYGVPWNSPINVRYTYLTLIMNFRIPRHVVKVFLSQKQRAFTRGDLGAFLEQYRTTDDGPPLKLRQFLEGLTLLGHLSETTVHSARKRGVPAYKSFTRYVTSKAREVDVALSLRPGAYLSHGTAAEILGLLRADQTVYVNKEQSPKPASHSVLSQESVDRAFKNAARMSRYVFTFRGKRIVLLSGKNTGDYGVVEHKSGLRMTGLERTLVDMAVRPAYAGGPLRVLQAYRTAVAKADTAKLTETIRHLNHAYPFHQAVGFYLHRAGKPLSSLKAFTQAGFPLPGGHPNSPSCGHLKFLHP